MRTARCFSYLFALGLGFVSSHALGDAFPTRAERLPSPGRSAASEDSVEAIVLNPANLGWQPAPEMRYTFVRCPDTQKVGCGHALGLGTPVLWGISTGLRLDFVQPPGGPEGAGFPYNGIDYAWLTFGLAKNFGPRFSMGATIQWSYSSNAYLDGLVGLTAGISYRPNTHFGFAAVAHDFNGSATQQLPPRFYPILDRSYVLAMAFRPTGTRALEIGAEAKFMEGIGTEGNGTVPPRSGVLPRLTLGLDVPGVGRARGDVEVYNLGSRDHSGVVGSAGLEIYFSKVSLGGGALFGSGLGGGNDVAQYATASIAGYVSPGVPRSQRAVYMRFESTPGPRSHVALLRRLWQLSEDKEVAGVTFVIKDEPAATYAHAEELADAIRVLKARGKKVLCAWEDAGPKALYTCASADRIVVNPAGGLRYKGLASSYFYLAKLLSNLGIKAEFVKIGDHKLAPEQFTNERSSDTGRADHEDLLRNQEAVFVRNLELYRKLSPEKIREATRKGPFTAAEARDAGFVDGYAFDDEVERATQDLIGRKVAYEKYEPETKAPEWFGARDKVGILYVDGDIIDGRSRRIPIVDMKLVGSYTIAEAAKQMREDNHIKAVVLRVESPGGSSMAADVMWRELKLLAEKKPLIVSMGSVAASGGYYVSAPGRVIFANPLTITGSIGIFYGKGEVSELFKKIGINVEVTKTTARADADSIFRPFTDDEKVELRRKVGQFYDVFLDRVSQGRSRALGKTVTKEQIDAVGQGRVWTGQQALQHGLVDRLGGIRQALEAARDAGGLPDDAPIVEGPVIEKTLLDQALELAGLKANGSFLTIDGLPVQLRDVARGVAPLAIYSGDVPLARMDWVPLEDVTGKDDE
jgi:protease-4